MCASARFWASVTADLRNRGVQDILIACCDGLNGFEDAIHAAFPHTVVQTCVVHLIRNSLRPVARRDAAAVWGAPKLPDSPSNRMDVWKGEVIASTEEELLTGIQR